MNDFPLNNNEEFDLYTDKSQVPYNYKPVIKFGFINSGNKADLNIKSMASCLGVDGIIKETNTRLTKSTELNPLYDVLFNDMPAEKNELVEETVVSYTLIIKDTSHQQVKDNLDKYELLLRLAELKEKGIISEKEFQEEKKKLLQEQ